jgi:hypothetical protein
MNPVPVRASGIARGLQPYRETHAGLLEHVESIELLEAKPMPAVESEPSRVLKRLKYRNLRKKLEFGENTEACPGDCKCYTGAAPARPGDGASKSCSLESSSESEATSSHEPAVDLD